MKFRSLREVRRVPCPFCTRMILFEDAALTVYHEVPRCAPFEAALTAHGLKPRRRVEPTAWVDLTPTEKPS